MLNLINKDGGYDIVFDFHLEFLLNDVSSGKNVVISRNYMNIDNKNKDALIFGEGLTQKLDNTTLTAEDKYPINITESGKRFVLSLHYNWNNSFLIVNATKIYSSKAKDSEIKPYPSCLANISKDFTLDNMKKKNRIKMKCKIFFLLVISLLILAMF